MRTSSAARLTPTELIVEVRGWSRLLAPWPRTIAVPRLAIENDSTVKARDVSSLLGWRLAGTGITPQRAMGCFTVRGQRGGRAWVWMTPGREMRLFQVRHGRLRVVAVPTDWFSTDPAD